MVVAGKELEAFADEKITVSTSVVTPTLATAALDGTSFKPARGALVTVESNDVRMRLDGTDPDTDTGHVLAAGDSVVLSGTGSIINAEFIRDGAADGVVHITYFR